MEKKKPGAEKGGGAVSAVLNCIDLSDRDLARSVSSLKQACLECGFFYVVNHGISEELMEEVFSQSRNLFALPDSEKMRVLRNDKNRGYTPVFDEILDPDHQLHGDYKEGYYLGVEGDPAAADKPFCGPNVWPAEEVLPGWRWTMERFHCEALEAGRAVARIIALALDLEADFFDRPDMLGEPIAVMRLLHYTGHVSDPSKGIYGAGAHSDFGLITLLATDDVYGLQICKDKEANPQVWEYVAPMKGAIVVNLGDMLERWSNCIFKSTLHRVLGNGQDRYSFRDTSVLYVLGKDDDNHFFAHIAFFVDPSHDCLVECLPTCRSETNPPKFPPINYGTYLSQRYKETQADLSVYSQQQTGGHCNAEIGL